VHHVDKQHYAWSPLSTANKMMPPFASTSTGSEKAAIRDSAAAPAMTVTELTDL
jgi:hypothetical protein